MSHKIKNTYKAVLSSVIVVTLFLTVFRTWLLFNRYSVTHGTFSTDSHSMVSIILFLTAFLIGVYAICLYKKVNLGECAITLPATFSSLFVAVVLLAYFLLSLIPFGNVVSYRFLRLIAIIFSLFSVPYFLYGILIREKKKSDKKILFCMAVTVFFVLYVIIRYLSSDYPSTSPIKIHETVSLIFITFFMLQECRASLGRTHWPIRIFIGLTAIAVMIPYCIPNLIYAVSENNAFSSEDLLSCFVIFAFSVYIAIDMFLLPLRENLKGEEDEPTPDYSDLIYASKVEADRFRISDEDVYTQKAKSTQLYTVNETVGEKINDGTLDTVGNFTYDSPDATEDEVLSQTVSQTQAEPEHGSVNNNNKNEDSSANDTDKENNDKKD